VFARVCVCVYCGVSVSADYNFDQPSAFDTAAIMKCLTELKVDYWLLAALLPARVSSATGAPIAVEPGL
jgi:hypothetical protein